MARFPAGGYSVTAAHPRTPRNIPFRIPVARIANPCTGGIGIRRPERVRGDMARPDNRTLKYPGTDVGAAVPAPSAHLPPPDVLLDMSLCTTATALIALTVSCVSTVSTTSGIDPVPPIARHETNTQPKAPGQFPPERCEPARLKHRHGIDPAGACPSRSNRPGRESRRGIRPASTPNRRSHAIPAVHGAEPFAGHRPSLHAACPMINPDTVSGPCAPRTAASHRTRTPAGTARPSDGRIPSGGSDHDAGSARLIRHLPYRIVSSGVLSWC